MAPLNDRGRWRSDRGSQLIELMIVFPLFMLLMAGLLDFGMMMRNYEVVTNAAREGARVAVLDSNYTDDDIEARVFAYLDSAGVTGDRNVLVANIPVVTPAGAFTARSVTLNYTYQWALLGGIAAFFGGNFDTLNLQATSIMRSEVQGAPPGP